MAHNRNLESLRGMWQLRPGVTYLNHGSFGPPPEPVQEARRVWQQRLDSQPMDFFVRQYEPAWRHARQIMADWIGADERNLIFVDNATVAMNVVAGSLALGPEDEVVLTDHEYGAVHRIWERATRRAGAPQPIIARLPMPIESADQILESIFTATTGRTRLLVVSHITSPTAVTLPVEQIVREAHRRGIAVCIDGPHAVAQYPLDLEQLACDFYCASCHKWLCAPFGSGFLYVATPHHETIQPPLLSWGRLLPDRVEVWSDEFIWSGTRDPSSYLAIPAAIEFLEKVGLDAFREATHDLASYARSRLVDLTGEIPIVPDSATWYGCMAHVPLPAGDSDRLQRRLWTEHNIEVPIIAWNDRRWIRVSCHLYNTRDDIDHLVASLKVCL